MVGGGSYTWMPRLLSDLMQTATLAGSRIVLLDINPEAAEEVAAAGRTMARTLNREFKITVTTDEAAAFRDADFVIITISTGGFEAMAHDLSIPEKYGIFQTVGDTVGPGGWSRSLRNIPVFAHLGEQLGKYAPSAMILNYTNPMATLTATLARTCPQPVVGLCHGVFENYHVLQKLFGVEEKDLAVNFGGLNHFFWFIDFTVNGQPGYPLLREKLGNKALDQLLGSGTKDAIGYHSYHALAGELFARYGYLPYLADRHTAEFLPEIISPRESDLKRFNLVRTSIEDRQNNLAQARQTTRELAEGKRQPYPRSRETVVDIITARLENRPFIDVVNLPNTGQIDNLPRGLVVETLGLIDSLGFRPVAAGPLPPAIVELLTPHCLCLEQTLEAALEGKRKLALEALALDPACAFLPPAKIEAMGTELMRATEAWLPQFK